MTRLVTGARLLVLAIMLAALPVTSSPPAWAGERQAPPIHSDTWINSPPLTTEALQGRVLLVEFWTFGCINCRHVEPHIKAWHAKYRAEGLSVIGVHAPELPFERDPEALQQYIREHGITWPVAVDNDFSNWHAWHNWAWPTLYLVDRQGHIRYQRIGEGGYEATEAMIRQLLAE